jgi:hypothetical protein
MKKSLIIFLLAPFFVLAQKTIGTRDDIQISKSLESNYAVLMFSKRVELSTNSIATNYVKAKKGYSFVNLTIRIKNTSKTKNVVDITKFKLIGDNASVYDASLCQANNLNKTNCDQFEFDLKPGKRRIVNITFSPQVLKSSTIKTIQYDGNVIYEFE